MRHSREARFGELAVRDALVPHTSASR